MAKVKPFARIGDKKEFDVFGPALKRTAANKYRFAMNLPKSLACANAGEQYSAKVKADFHSTVAINGRNLKDIVAKDNTKTADATAIDKEVAACVVATAKTHNVLKAYKEHIGAINELLGDDKDLKYHVFQVINALHTLRSNTLESLKKQQESEITALEKKFTDSSSFAANIKKMYDIPDQDSSHTYDAVKKEYLDALKKKHTEQNKAFNDAIEKDLTEIHKESQKEVERLSFIASMYHSNKKVREEIDKIRAKKAPKNQPVSIGSGDVVTVDEQWATFRGIEPKDVENLQSLHRNLVWRNNITRAEDGSYSMKIRSGGYQLNLMLFKVSVGSRAEEKIKDDLLTLAEAVRASGFDTITFDISHKIRENPATAKEFDEEHSQLLWRKAYEAAIQAGFKTENITIRTVDPVSGREKTYKGEEIRGLFGKNPSDLKMADEIAKQTQTIYEDLKEQHQRITQTERTDFYEAAKQKLQEVRNKANPPAGNPPAGGLASAEDLLDPQFKPQ